MILHLERTPYYPGVDEIRSLVVVSYTVVLTSGTVTSGTSDLHAQDNFTGSSPMRVNLSTCSSRPSCLYTKLFF